MQLLKPKSFHLLIPGCGLLALLLRMILAAGVDGKGLIPAGHPAWIGLWILTTAVAVILMAGTHAIQGPDRYQECFPGSVFSAGGAVLAAILALLMALRHWQSGPTGRDPVSLITFLLGGVVMTLAGVGMIWTALCRLTERRPLFLSHAALCVCLALKVLSLYQTWSFDPQLSDYCFQLLACIALTMTAYHLAAFDADRGSHRRLWFWTLAAVYLCCACLDDGLFYFSGALWALTNRTSLRIRRERRHITPDISPDENM